MRCRPLVALAITSLPALARAGEVEVEAGLGIGVTDTRCQREHSLAPAGHHSAQPSRPAIAGEGGCDAGLGSRRLARGQRWGYAVAMVIEWDKGTLLISEINHAVRSGGLTAPARSALAERFGVSEELVLHYERATSAYNSLSDEWRHQARQEAGLRLRERGEKFDPQKFAGEMGAAFDRIEEAEWENEITRELRAAAAALREALGCTREYKQAMAALYAATDASTRSKTPRRT